MLKEMFSDIWMFCGNSVNPTFKAYGLMTTIRTVQVQEGLLAVGKHLQDTAHTKP